MTAGLPELHQNESKSNVMSNPELMALLKELDMQEVPIRDLGPIRIFLKGPQSMNEYYEDSAREFGSITCFVDGDKVLSYADAYAEAKDFACFLRDVSVKAGDRVAIAARNCYEWFVAFMGITMLNAVAVPLNAWWVAKELKYGLLDSAAVVLVCDHERLERGVLELLADPKTPLQHAVLVRVPASAASGLPSGVKGLHTWQQAVSGGDDGSWRTDNDSRAGRARDLRDPWCAVPKDNPNDDNCVIMYTSGTTGNPKGVVLTVRNVLSSCMNAVKLRAKMQGVPALANGRGDSKVAPHQSCMLVNVPLFHAAGLFVAFLYGLGTGSPYWTGV